MMDRVSKGGILNCKTICMLHCVAGCLVHGKRTSHATAQAKIEIHQGRKNIHRAMPCWFGFRDTNGCWVVLPRLSTCATIWLPRLCLLSALHALNLAQRASFPSHKGTPVHDGGGTVQRIQFIAVV